MSLPDDQVIAAAQKRGLAFQVTPEMTQRMKDNDVSESVIKALAGGSSQTAAAQRFAL